LVTTRYCSIQRPFTVSLHLQQVYNEVIDPSQRVSCQSRQVFRQVCKNSHRELEAL